MGLRVNDDRQAEVDRPGQLAFAGSVEADQLAGCFIQAGLQAGDFSEPSVVVGFVDAFAEVGDDLHEPRSCAWVEAQAGAADAGVFVFAGGARLPGLADAYGLGPKGQALVHRGGLGFRECPVERGDRRRLARVRPGLDGELLRDVGGGDALVLQRPGLTPRSPPGSCHTRSTYAAATTLLTLGLSWGTANAATNETDQVAQAAVPAATALAACVGPGSPDGGALACFNPTGEHLLNCDLLADGHHPEAYYYRSTSPNTLRHISDAPEAGNCVDHDLTDIPESGWIYVQSCNYEGDTELSCSNFVYVYAEG
ncbi:hypothetical protein [Amycolatopsis sp. NPDC050768]|uniref:hypothetical protein n=1 Tax=Amycolatopsis sp. NPDC050768 TaxID=3154839 RepID=UPI0033DEF6C8